MFVLHFDCVYIQVDEIVCVCKCKNTKLNDIQIHFINLNQVQIFPPDWDLKVHAPVHLDK